MGKVRMTNWKKKGPSLPQEKEKQSAHETPTQRKTHFRAFRRFLFGFGGCRTALMAASNTAFTFCKSDQSIKCVNSQLWLGYLQSLSL